MAKNNGKLSLFERAMNFADRFFEGINKFKEISKKAEQENIEFFDEKFPGYKEQYEKSMKSAAELGSKLEAKAETIIFGKDLYLGAGGPERKIAVEKESLDAKIKSASSKQSHINNSTEQKSKESERER